MHKITRIISDFLQSTLGDESLRSTLSNGSVTDSTEHHTYVVLQALERIKQNSRHAVIALQEFRATAPDARTPEKLRSATGNLVRSVESFKAAFSGLHPQSNVQNHPLVGCLYGYEQRRTATLDKAALIAYEISVDVWALEDEGLEYLVSESVEAQKLIERHVDDFAMFVDQMMTRQEIA